MIAKLLPVILLIVGTGAGIGAGIMLAPAPAPTAAHATDDSMADDLDHSEEAADSHTDDDAGSDHLAPEKDREYVKIDNQFVIPVVERDNLSSLVVIALSLEAKPGMSEKIRLLEPKLRDAFLQVLFDHANMGGFRGAFTRSDVLNPLRTALREAAQKELGKGIYDVLIVEISRQDV
ncbi:flagellar basal body-associated FliL family protein [Pseudophaeobacter flagellatus]|uniref:flagellar basal body-associated FliL family protein n=1 Tax=Pseudophaeobacter flagellatus TaxID=2899119 RepID=UPI001E4513CF|nr:flagellar basal body-associated FliL family protein [Pseudophaeobacter flagellatus]MCD9147117.1 flagellar basal body-associated FliL family protein [Pseudophaeobacter flagellatus]